MSSSDKATAAREDADSRARTDTPLEVRLLADKLGVRLYVKPGEDKLMAGPPNKVTPRLKEGIKAHRDMLLRDVLASQASEAAHAAWPEGLDWRSDGDMAITWSIMADRRYDGTLEEHRERCQEYIRATQRYARQLQKEEEGGNDEG